MTVKLHNKLGNKLLAYVSCCYCFHQKSWMFYRHIVLLRIHSYPSCNGYVAEGNSQDLAGAPHVDSRNTSE